MGVGGKSPGGLQHPLDHSLQFEQLEQHEPAVDVLDQFLSIPSWTEIGGVGSGPWDYTASNFPAPMQMGAAQKGFSMSLIPGFRGGALEVGGAGGNCVEVTAEAMLLARLQQQHAAMQKNPATPADILVEGGRSSPDARGAPDMAQGAAIGGGLQLSASLTRSQSVGRSCSEKSGGPQGRGECLSQQHVAPTWPQVPPLATRIAQAKAETMLPGGQSNSGDRHLLGEGQGEVDDVCLQDNRVGYSGGGQTESQLRQGYGGQESCMQLPGGIPGGLGGGLRPRVRARRGHATDPHSIAERLRRERIAERLKALQELVPNCNKTDKASMLGEIIDYVKFLQIQVKILGLIVGMGGQGLSMSRLGGAALADLPSEGQKKYAVAILSSTTGAAGPVQEALALTEHQAALLIEDDMGQALQHLLARGMVLMPVSLATAISTHNNSHPPGGSQSAAKGDGNRQWLSAVGADRLASYGPDNIVPSMAGRSSKDIREAETAHAATGASEGEKSDNCPGGSE